MQTDLAQAQYYMDQRAIDNTHSLVPDFIPVCRQRFISGSYVSRHPFGGSAESASAGIL